MQKKTNIMGTGAKLNKYNFQPLEVVSRYSDPQQQVAENYIYL